MACSSSSSSADRRAGTVVCVTGAGGFIGSWVVKLLLQRGYTVRGTARDPEDPKNHHLRSLDGARERLSLFKADLLDYAGIRRAISGCDGVFHTATPITNDPGQVATAVDGTKNVMNAAAEARVRRVVFTSTFGAVDMDPRRSPDTVVDESCWSDLDFCKKTNNWYCYGKMMAELAAEAVAREKELELASVVPTVTVGPMLQPTLNTTVREVLKYVSGAKKVYRNVLHGLVDVRDVAEAHLLVYESPSARGRYLCVERVQHHGDLMEILAELFPTYPVTSRCEDESSARVKPYKFSNQRLKDLGLQFTPIKRSLYDMVVSAREKGHLLPPSSYYNSSL